MLEIKIDPEVSGLLLGVVSARGPSIGPSSGALRAACQEIVAQVMREGMGGGEPRREAVRQMLRAGGFRPAGRNKPAQEYLLRTITGSHELPSILNMVDWLNAISLRSGLPISLLSAASLGERSLVRYGRAGEKFVFNRAGQELELGGLICLCEAPGDVPLGTPIKDSMAGKIGEHDENVVAVLYAPVAVVAGEELAAWCDQLARGFREYCGAGECASFCVQA